MCVTMTAIMIRGATMVGSGLVPDVLRRSLVTKFVVTLVVLGAIIGVVGFVATDQIRAETKENVEREYEGLAQSKAAVVGEWAEQNQLTTRRLSTTERWTGSADGMQAALEREKAQLPDDINRLYVVESSVQGQESVASTSDTDGIPAPLQAWLSRQDFGSADSVRLTLPYQSGGQSVMAMVSPVPGQDGRLFVMEISLSSLSETIQAGGASEGQVQVVDSDYVIIASEQGGSDDDVVIGSKYATGTARDPIDTALAMDAGEAGVTEELPGTEKIVNEPYTAGYAPIPTTNWVVVVHTPRSQLFGFVQQVSTWGSVATGGLVVLVVLLGAGLGLHVTRSVERLGAKATEMEQGNLAVDLETERIDEIGDLYKSFDSMRREVRQRILDAEEARDAAQEARDEKAEMRDDIQAIAEHIERKATQYSEVMQQCAAGDLTQRLDPQSKSKDMTEIARSFNEMMAELESAIDQVADFATEVESGSQVVMNSAESVSKASDEVAESMQQLSVANQEQKERLERFAEDLHAVAASFEDAPETLPPDVRQHVETIQSLTTELDDLTAASEETLAEVESVAAAAEEQTTALGEVTESATDLYDYAAPLGTELGEFQTDADSEFRFEGASTDDD